MAINLNAPLRHLKSRLQALGEFSRVQIGEPKGPVAEGVTAAIFREGTTHPETTLTGTIERREVVIRLYANLAIGNEEELELQLDRIEPLVSETILAHFILGVAEGSGIRCTEPTSIVTRYGYVTITNVIHRTVDTIIAVTVDDSAAFAA